MMFGFQKVPYVTRNMLGGRYMAAGVAAAQPDPLAGTSAARQGPVSVRQEAYGDGTIVYVVSRSEAEALAGLRTVCPSFLPQRKRDLDAAVSGRIRRLLEEDRERRFTDPDLQIYGRRR